MGACVGSALAGFRPIAEILLMNSVTVAMDQIVNHAAKLRFISGGQTNVPLVIRTTTGVGVGFGGQHSDMLEAWFAHVPGLKIVTPSNAADAYGLMLWAIECNDPVIFIENILCYGQAAEAPPTGTRVPLGKAAVAREGADVSLVTYGRTVLDALEVAGQLEGDGVSVEVIDLRTIAPYDEETVLASVRKTGRAVVLHEAVKAYGTGVEISARLHENLFAELKAPVQRVGAAFSSVPMANCLEQAARTRSRPRSAPPRLDKVMASEIRIPKIGMSATSMTLAEWMVGNGESVAKGDIIYTVETAKTTVEVEVEAQASGTLRVVAEEGADYPVGTLVGTIE